MSKSMSASKAKEKAKERDGYECRFCGVTREEYKEDSGMDLEAHHIIKDRDRGQDHPSNLITVCRSCHRTLESTQADALSRIREKHLEEAKQTWERQQDNEVKNRLQSQLHGLARENLKLRGQIESEKTANTELLSCIHRLERELRSPDILVDSIKGNYVQAEVVTEHLGNRVSVNAEHEPAYEDYEEWGSQIRRVNVSLSNEDAERFTNEMIDAFQRKRKYL